MWYILVQHYKYYVIFSRKGVYLERIITRKERKQRKMEENNKRGKYGIVDIPCEELEDMELDAVSYIKGLEEFIKNCPAPLSIALQGEWGTGKTSFIKIIQKDIEKENIVTVYFNTWQYSQFNMSESLYISFISGILKKLERPAQEKEIKELLNKLGRLVISFGKQKLGDILGINIDAISKKVIDNECDKAELIEGFKEDFSEIVKNTVGESGKVIIFVDDLDRLNPEVAVELLEVIKLFMDVKRCVFILAVDYEVVVSGVRKKYGNNLTDEKCRSFFDKIIQVPFTMPVDKYNIKEMFIKKFEKSICEEYLEPVSELFSETIGANPRTFIRFSNSFYLLETIWDKQGIVNKEKSPKDSCLKSLLLTSLVVQMYSPGLYKELLSVGGNTKKLKEQLEVSKENSDKEMRNEEEQKDDKIKADLKQTLEMLREIKTHECKEENIYDKFIEALNLSSSTATTSAGAGKTQVVSKITKICIKNEYYPASNATEALVKTYNIILDKYKDNLPQDFMEQQKNILTHDENENKSLFRASKKLAATYNGKDVFLGTSSGTPVKISQAKKLCKQLNLPAGEVIWYSGDEVVFSNGTD